MTYRYTRLRVRRRMRKRKKQVVGLGESANKQLDRHIFRRWHNFKNAGRFAIGWFGLVVLLIVAVTFQTLSLGKHYLTSNPVAGGVYTEGVVGSFSNASPLYATDDVDTAVSKLLFDSLLTYDDKNQLKGDLAASWTVDGRGTTYTVTLKPNLFWHDGQPLTTDDVVFTYDTIKNPDAKSPLLSSWTGVKIEKVDKRVVKFILPNAYSPFAYALTNGIVPKHILGKYPAEQLRSVSFNTKNPVGSGPFEWKGIVLHGDNNADQTETIQLQRFAKYHDGAPKLDGVAITAYKNEDALRQALQDNKIIAAAGLSFSDKEIDSRYNTFGYSLMSANMIFLRTTSPILSDKMVRQALIKATDVPALSAKIDYPTIPVREPILSSQIGYNPAYEQLGFDKAGAMKLLDDAGWKINGKDQFRTKSGKKLSIKLTYQVNHEFSHIADGLQKQWADVGVELSVDITQNKNDSSKYLDSHEYDALLYGINIGPDPDVYAYWHSSQIDKKSQIHLNLSEYKSAVTDTALEAGRTRTDAKLRAAKYKPFLQAWHNDVPAIGLYQPRYLVASNQHIYNMQQSLTINTPSERFNNVDKWMINTNRK